MSLQVAVVGSQSSGKSSVLEALVGKTVWWPLVLQLVQTVWKPDDHSELIKWGEFLHLPGCQSSDFQQSTKRSR
jgi:hypothetical protein